jgi:hypothetical protein
MSSVLEDSYTTTDLWDDHNQLHLSSSLFLQESQESTAQFINAVHRYLLQNYATHAQGATFLGEVSGDVAVNMYVSGGNMYINTNQAERRECKKHEKRAKTQGITP